MDPGIVSVFLYTDQLTLSALLYWLHRQVGLQQLLCHDQRPPVVQGVLTDTILATVEDYLNEYLTYLQPQFGTRCTPTRAAFSIYSRIKENRPTTFQVAGPTALLFGTCCTAMLYTFKQCS